MSAPVIERARRYLAKLPPAISGSGGHDATYKAAAVLVHGFALDEDEALSLLREFNARCSPPWSEAELFHKVKSVRPGQKPRGYLLEERERAGVSPAPRAAAGAPLAGPGSGPDGWPEKDPGLILELLAGDFFRLADLEEMSPVSPAEMNRAPLTLIDHLFTAGSAAAGVSDPLLCMAGDLATARTRPWSEWQRTRIGELQFIVPNPMKARTGLKQDGRESERCSGNVGPRRFLVVECDFSREKDEAIFGRLDEAGATVVDACAAVLGRLAEFAPLVMAVHSGGKSLHGWFSVTASSERQQRRFFEYARNLGADKVTWTPCHLVRLPGGLRRANGARQTVHFFDPDIELLGR